MLAKFGKFLRLYGLWFYDLISQHKWLYVTSSYPCPWIKYLSAKITKYILKCWERSVKRKSNISFRVIKNSSFDQCFLMVKTFLKILWWRFLVPHSEHLLVSSATLSCMTQNILTLSMLVYYNTNSFFLRSFSLMHWLPGLFSSLIKVLSVQLSITSSFWSFIVSCCSLILLLSNIASSEGLFRYATSISRCLASWQFPHHHKHFLALAVYLALLPATIVLRSLANLLE